MPFGHGAMGKKATADTRLPHTILGVDGARKPSRGKMGATTMDKPVDMTEQAHELRLRAEELALRHAAPASADPESTLPAWAVDMIHELRVHQIELEMQNEELRGAQAKLDEANARYFDLYDLAPVGYFTLSESGVILEANLYAASRLGLPRVALVQQPFTRFIFREDQDSFYLHRRKLSESGSAKSWDLRMVRQDGTPFWAHLDAANAWEADGPPVLRLTMGDISMQKLVEDRQRRLEAELRHAQSMESLGTLAGGIAHDMNNVLGAILGVASANLDNQPDGSPIYHAFDIITRAAERGAVMVRGLQSLAGREPAEEKELNPKRTEAWNRVTLRFPALEGASQADASVIAPSADPAPRSLKVLVVDDDDLIRASMQTLLETLGHTSAMASGGHEAIAMLEAGLEADVVILDMNMPGLDGAGTLPRIHSLRPNLPVLIATGRVDQTTADLINLFPGIHVVPKPFKMDVLQKQLERLERN